MLVGFGFVVTRCTRRLGATIVQCAVIFALGGLWAGCGGDAGSHRVSTGVGATEPPGGTIGFPSSEGLNTVYVLISARTGVVKRLRVRHADRHRVFLFWYDGARMWTLDGRGVNLISAQGVIRHRVPIKASTRTREIGGLSWLPDGHRFAYTDGGGLFVGSVRGPQPRRLVAGEDLYEADWSPRGDRIFFVQGDASEPGYGHIRAVYIDGRRVPLSLPGFHPDVSPDGRKLAFATPAGVFVLPLQGGRAKFVAPGGDNPEWSPDGRYLAFTRAVSCSDVGCSGRVFFVRSSGGHPRALGPQQFDIGPLFWSS